MWTSLVAKLTQLFTSATLDEVIKIVGLLFTSIVAHWRAYAILGLIGLSAAGCYGWSHDHNSLLKERQAHQADIVAFKKAQADANTKAQEYRVSLEKESQANADQADAKYATLLAEYRISLLRYKASQGGSVSASDSQLQPTQSSNGPGSGSVVPQGSIVISGDDALICAVNTARLQAVHDWAINPPKDGKQ